MIVSTLLAALLAVPASAQPVACVENEMTREWEKISFALWLTDYTIPDSSPRTATLSYKNCFADEERGQETRFFVSEDGSIGVVATTSLGGQDGATYLSSASGGTTACTTAASASTRPRSRTGATADARSSRTSS
jgi:hypothetical protein